ncbi:MAG: DUF502 domain-containing protein [Thermoanaerobaculia bacterium]
MNFLIKNFLRGLAILIPIVATIWLVWITFLTIDRWIQAPYPGVGIGVTILLILAVGMLAGNVIGRKLFHLTEMIFMRAPLVKIIYLAIKDLVEAFVGDRKKFNRPVLVSLSGIEASALGFVTRDRIDFLSERDLVAVYFPQSYNFAGNLLLVPAARITPIDADSTQVMAFIVSGGISGGAQRDLVKESDSRSPGGS